MLLVLPEGHDYSQVFQVRDAANAVVDLTSYTAISLAVYDTDELYTGAPTAVFTWSIAGGEITVDSDPTTGLITLAVADTVTDGLGGSRYQWEMRGTVGGLYHYFGGGELYIDPRSRQDGV